MRVQRIFAVLLTTVFLLSSLPVLAASSATSSSSRKPDKQTVSSAKKRATSKSKKGESSSREKNNKKKKTTTSSKKKTARVNINTATAGELTQLTGIGPKTAANIVAYRKKNGRFKKASDLLKVKGIGEQKLNKMKSQLKF